MKHRTNIQVPTLLETTVSAVSSEAILAPSTLEREERVGFLGAWGQMQCGASGTREAPRTPQECGEATLLGALRGAFEMSSKATEEREQTQIDRGGTEMGGAEGANRGDGGRGGSDGGDGRRRTGDRRPPPAMCCFICHASAGNNTKNNRAGTLRQIIRYSQHGEKRRPDRAGPIVRGMAVVKSSDNTRCA